MYKLYYLVSPSTRYYYIGMTKNKLSTRLNQHKSCAARGIKSPLYDCMRKYGDFVIVLVEDNLTHTECCELEIANIAEAITLGHDILNLAAGGNGGFVVQDLDAWKEKLRAKRKNRKPALGMKHTKENKELFAKLSKENWEARGTYDAEKVTKVPYKEAHTLYGISKTHYYRLKRSLCNEQ